MFSECLILIIATHLKNKTAIVMTTSYWKLGVVLEHCCMKLCFKQWTVFLLTDFLSFKCVILTVFYCVFLT